MPGDEIGALFGPFAKGVLGILKIAVPALLSFLLGMLFPNAIRLDVRAFLTYWLFERWRLSWRLWRHARTIGYRVAICGFYRIDPDGRLLTMGQWFELSSQIKSELALLIKDHSTVVHYCRSNPWLALRVSSITIPAYARYTGRLEGFAKFVNRRIANRKMFALSIWGTLDPHYPPQIRFQEAPQFFTPHTPDQSALLSRLVGAAGSALPIPAFARYLALLIYGLYQQSFVTALGLGAKKPIEARLLLDDGFSTIAKAIAVLEQHFVSPNVIDQHRRALLTEYHGLRATLLQAEGVGLEAAIEFGRSLENNPYWPSDSENEFKSGVLRRYAFEVVQRSVQPEVVAMLDEQQPDQNRKRVSERLEFYRSTFHWTTLDRFVSLLLTLPEEEFREACGCFERLRGRIPNSAVPLVYWGDAIRAYGSEPGQFNSAKLDEALAKYLEAERLDPEWELIPVKILMTYMFKKQLGNAGEDVEPAIATYMRKSQRFYEHPEVAKFTGGSVFRRRTAVDS